MTSHEMFKKIVQFDNWVGGLLGMDIFSEGYTIYNFKFLSEMANFVFLVVLNFYDLFLYRNDVARVCFILVTLFAAGQAAIKLYTFIVFLGSMRDHVARAEKYITNFSTKASDGIFVEWLMIICHSFLVTIILFFSINLLISIYPIIFYFVFGERVLHFGFELPFIDWRTSNVGYIINFAWCCSCAAQYCIAGVSAIFLSTFPIILSFGQFELIISFLKDLDELIKSNDKGKNDDGIKKHVKMIVEMHNELLEFLGEYSVIYNRYFFIEFGCLIGQSIVALYAIVTVKFLLGYVMCLSAMFQIFLPCFLAQILILKGDELYHNVCNVSWYSMTSSEKKSMALLMLATANPQSMMCGLMEMKLQMFVEIYKTIYSYFTILLRTKD